MFLANNFNVDFDGLSFCGRVPNDNEITEIYQKIEAIINGEKITPATVCGIAELVRPLIQSFPEEWPQLPSISQNRLLYEIGKYISVESLSIPELKKK